MAISVSKNTLYRYIRQERQAGGELYQQLPHRGKRYRYNAENLKSGPIPNRVGIEYRPAQAELKQEPGHFEIDTIFGKDQKSFLLTIVDNALKTVIIRKLPNKRAETVVAAFRDIEANTFCKFKTLTADIANRLKNDYILCPDMRQRSIAGCYQNNVAWL
ncbi:IS30 family transposase [Symbiopectobacterium purcellii]|uniref:IS30 family transposase n=1 Tax=Symbiopectobacterium purcellii TaxID=2871826 RepID=UPI003F862214